MPAAGSDGTAGWEPDREFWRHRPVAVTGGTGFLGSHLVFVLVGLGAEVVVLTRDRVPLTDINAGWSGAVSLVEGEVEDQMVCERLLGEYGVSTVFHLAAQTQVSVANRNPVSTFEANIRGTWSLLEAARRSPVVTAIVAASSDKAYGSQSALPYHEDMPLLAVHPYDVSKACGDLLASAYASTWGLPVATTRCGNFFGPGDTNWDRLVPGTIRSVLEGRRPEIRSDGKPTRDYLYVVDAVMAYLCLAEAVTANPALTGEAFNFSTEEPVTVLRLTELIQRAAETALDPVILATATNEIADQSLSAGKARRMLGWQPSHSLEEALVRTVGWYRDHLSR